MTRIEEIGAREKAASEGPWRWDTEQETKAIVIFRDDGEIILADGDYFLDEDAEFAAHAREDIPYLLAQLREARGKLEAVETYVGDLRIGSATFPWQSLAADELDRILHPKEGE